jgi:ankyrin repeat protein
VRVVRQTDGLTPLYAASENGHVEVVRALVGAGAAVNQADVRDDWGCFWCSSARGGWAWGVFGAHGVLGVVPRLLMLRRTGGCVPLRVNELCGPSSCRGSVCVVRQSGGITPLCATSESGHVEVVRALVGAGAAVNQATVREDWGECWCSGVRGCLVFGLLHALCVRDVCVCSCGVRMASGAAMLMQRFESRRGPSM